MFLLILAEDMRARRRTWKAIQRAAVVIACVGVGVAATLVIGSLTGGESPGRSEKSTSDSFTDTSE